MKNIRNFPSDLVHQEWLKEREISQSFSSVLNIRRRGFSFVLQVS